MPDVVDYNFHIRPIFSDRCFKCHGPDANQRKAELRLDKEEGLYQALKDDPDGHVIVPGKPNFSELYLRISASDTQAGTSTGLVTPERLLVGSALSSASRLRHLNWPDAYLFSE